MAATKLFLSLTRIDFVVTDSSRAVRVFSTLSLRRLRPSYGTFSLVVFQGNCTRGRTDHMIKMLIEQFVVTFLFFLFLSYCYISIFQLFTCVFWHNFWRPEDTCLLSFFVNIYKSLFIPCKAYSAVWCIHIHTIGTFLLVAVSTTCTQGGTLKVYLCTLAQPSTHLQTGIVD